MAAAVVTVVVEDILKSLGEGMKLGKIWGIEHELREIHDLLSSIQGVLTEAENKYGLSLEVQTWVRILKRAAFHVEDLLEELSVEKALQQREWNVCRLFRVIDRITFRGRMRGELRDVARQMRDIIITSNLVRFVRNIPSEIGEVHEAARAVPLIGRDHEKGELRRLLLDRGREQNLPVVTIFGDRGMGKTSLVQEVLSELEVCRHFDYIIWVNASPPFDENRMARDIIASLTKGGATEEENVVKEQLLARIWKLLDGRKKYLFILDDLLVHDHSEGERWSRFWSFIEGGATGSKIIVTTPEPKEIFNDESVLYLGGLTKEDSLDLLLKTAFRGGVEEMIEPAKLQFAEQVASECHGNPLFIRAVGGYLSLQHDACNVRNFHARQVFDEISERH